MEEFGVKSGAGSAFNDYLGDKKSGKKELNKEITLQDVVPLMKKGIEEAIEIKRDSISTPFDFDNSIDHGARIAAMVSSAAREVPGLVKEHEKPLPNPGLGDSDDGWQS